ncbi:MAG: TraR/DksA C4-type zinc finger protein [Planctomycetales bacterium]|nr:TraR/DksA C4-type zinc finger protein [Planctomycetales bacterium]
MPKPTRIWQLQCSACGHRAISANAEMVSRMRTVGMLMRDKSPDPRLLDALLPTAAARMRCDGCGQTGLNIEPFEDEWDDAAFSGGRSCESCGSIIPAERLAALPDTRVCARCQQSRESGRSSDEPEFCPRCGDLLQMRSTSQGGVTRYAMWCRTCGK